MPKIKCKECESTNIVCACREDQLAMAMALIRAVEPELKAIALLNLPNHPNRFIRP